MPEETPETTRTDTMLAFIADMIAFYANVAIFATILFPIAGLIACLNEHEHR